jgi:riboflavin biosynthesis pyrimidine reductase
MPSVGNDWTRQRFDGPFYLSPVPQAHRPSCSLVFVRSSDGNTGTRNPITLGGGATDTHVIYEGLSRVAADAVLAGAETIRGGNVILSVWHPELVRLRLSLGLPRHPVQMVATLQGLDIEHSLMFNVPEVPVVLVTVPDCAVRLRPALRARPWIREIVMVDRREIGRAFERFTELGVHRVSCIGGRRLAGSLVDAGLVDEVYLTTAPRPGGDPGTPLPPAALDGRVVVRKRGTQGETGVVFEHVVLPPGQGVLPIL